MVPQLFHLPPSQVRLHNRSGMLGASGSYALSVARNSSLVGSLLTSLQEELAQHEFQKADSASRSPTAFLMPPPTIPPHHISLHHT